MKTAPNTPRTRVGRTLATFAGLCIALPALAQWAPDAYTIQRIGLYGPQFGPNTISAASQPSLRMTATGQVVGLAFRTVDAGQAWVWDGQATHSLGLTGPEHTGSTGLQDSHGTHQTESGRILGTSSRFLDASPANGQDAWVWNAGVIQLVGPVGPEYTTSAGYRLADPRGLTESGMVFGRTSRVLGSNTSYGGDAWVWSDGGTELVGLFGANYTGSGGYRSTNPRQMNQAGQLCGYTARVAGLDTDAGRDAWRWEQGEIQIIGLFGAEYTGTNGYRSSTPMAINEAGLVTGFTFRIIDASTINGQDAWIFDGETTRRIGLTGPEFTGAQGLRNDAATSAGLPANALGHVVGYTKRYLGANTDNGQDAWLWDGHATTAIGLFGPDHFGTLGYHYDYASPASDAGLVTGSTVRVLDVSTSNGQDTWAHRNGVTHQTNLTAPEYTGSAGYREAYSSPAPDGVSVVGVSRRITGERTIDGQDAWFWQDGVTTLIGLFAPEYTGSAGYRYSDRVTLTSNDRSIHGYTRRITGVNTNNGQDAWIFDGTSTIPVGLSGPQYIGAVGYRYSSFVAENRAGHLAGYTSRITGTSSKTGQDAWYYDPATGVTSAIVGSETTAGNYASSSITLLTEDGFALGTYTLFLTGTESTGPIRAFVFRPDMGFADLGEVVEGGLSANAWDFLQAPALSRTASTIVGVGKVAGTSGIQDLFALVTGDAPGCPACAADYNQDGGVTGGDVGAFFNDFESGAACADVDQDGGITGGDLGAFFAVFEAGGC